MTKLKIITVSADVLVSSCEEIMIKMHKIIFSGHFL